MIREYPLPITQFPKWQRVLTLQETVNRIIHQDDKMIDFWEIEVERTMKESLLYKYISEKKDVWKSPDEFSNDGGGDCEDYAIWFMFRLYYRDIPLSRIELQVGTITSGQVHCVCVVYPHNDDYGVVLDCMHTIAMDLSLHRRFFKPKFALSTKGGRIIE